MSQENRKVSHNVSSSTELLKHTNNISPSKLLPIMTYRKNREHSFSSHNNNYTTTTTTTTTTVDNVKSSVTETPKPKKRLFVENNDNDNDNDNDDEDENIDTATSSAKRINRLPPEYHYPEEQNKLLSLLKSRMKISKSSSPKQSIQNEFNLEKPNTIIESKNKSPNSLVPNEVINSQSVLNKSKATNISIFKSTSNNNPNTGNSGRQINKETFLSSMRSFIDRKYHNQDVDSPTNNHTANSTHNNSNQENRTDLSLSQSKVKPIHNEISTPVSSNSTPVISQHKDDKSPLPVKKDSMGDEPANNKEHSSIGILSQKPIIIDLENDTSSDKDDVNVEKAKHNHDLTQSKQSRPSIPEENQIHSIVTKKLKELVRIQQNTDPEPESYLGLAGPSTDFSSTINEADKADNASEEENTHTNNEIPSTKNIDVVHSQSSPNSVRRSSPNNTTYCSLKQTINEAQKALTTNKTDATTSIEYDASQNETNITDKTLSNNVDPSIFNTQQVKNTLLSTKRINPIQPFQKSSSDETVDFPDVKRQKITENSKSIIQDTDAPKVVSNNSNTGRSIPLITRNTVYIASRSSPPPLPDPKQRSPTNPRILPTASSIQPDQASNTEKSSSPDMENIVKQEEFSGSLKDGIVQNDFGPFRTRLSTSKALNKTPSHHSATLEVIYISDSDSEEQVEEKSSTSEVIEDSDLDGDATSLSKNNEKVKPQEVVETNTVYISADIPNEEIGGERKRYDSRLNRRAMRTLNAFKSHHRNDMIQLIESGVIAHTSLVSNSLVSSTNNVYQSKNFETSPALDYQQLHKRDRLREIPLARVLDPAFINRGANLTIVDESPGKMEKRITDGISYKSSKTVTKESENKNSEIPASLDYKVFPKECNENNATGEDKTPKSPKNSNAINNKQLKESPMPTSEKDKGPNSSSRELWRKDWIDNLKLCYIYPYEAYPSNKLPEEDKKSLDHSFRLIKRILKEKYNVPLLTSFDPKAHIVILKGDISDFKGNKGFEVIQNTVQTGTNDKKVRVWSLNKVTKFLENMELIPGTEHPKKPEADSHQPLLGNNETDNSQITQVPNSQKSIDNTKTEKEDQAEPTRDNKSSKDNKDSDNGNKSKEDTHIDVADKESSRIENTSCRIGNAEVEQSTVNIEYKTNTSLHPNSIIKDGTPNLPKNNIISSQPDTNNATIAVDMYEEQENGLMITKMMSNLEELLKKVTLELQKEREENTKTQACLFELTNKLLKHEMTNSSLHACFNLEKKEKELVEKERDYLKETIKKMKDESQLFKDIADKRLNDSKKPDSQTKQQKTK